MIKVDRQSTPDSLNKNADQWTKDLLSILEQLEQEQNEREQAKLLDQKKKTIVKYKQDDVKETLKAMFRGKCAYCESKITTVSYGDIEHFYPKSSYPEKTFLWENLLLACSICNRTYKKDKFPITIDGEPLLLNPTQQNIELEKHLDFLWDETTSLALIKPLDEHGKTTVDILGLNSRVELLEARSKQLKIVRTLSLMSQEKNSPNATHAKQLLQELLEDSYSAFLKKHIAN